MIPNIIKKRRDIKSTLNIFGIALKSARIETY